MIEDVVEEGEPRIKVTGVFGSVTKTIYLTEAKAAGLTGLCFIKYNDTSTIDTEDIAISDNPSQINLAKPFADWDEIEYTDANGNPVKWLKGTIETIDQYRLGTINDSGSLDLNFYDYDGCYFLELDVSGSKPVVSASSESKINIGDQVYYNLKDSGVAGVIIVKE